MKGFRDRDTRVLSGWVVGLQFVDAAKYSVSVLPRPRVEVLVFELWQYREVWKWDKGKGIQGSEAYPERTLGLLHSPPHTFCLP